MGSSTLDRLPDGARVFIDANIFIYHFTGLSSSCRRLLERCELGAIRGLTSVTALAEVAHRLMLIEAVSRGLATPGGVVKQLRAHPERVRELQEYQRQTARVPLMGVDVLSVTSTTWAQADLLRAELGLLVNDSLIAASAIEADAHALASADRDFERLAAVTLYTPDDLSGQASPR